MRWTLLFIELIESIRGKGAAVLGLVETMWTTFGTTLGRHKIDQQEISSSKQQFLGFLKRWCKNSPYLPTLLNPATGQRRGNHGLTLPLHHSVSFSVCRSLRNNALHPPTTSLRIGVQTPSPPQNSGRRWAVRRLLHRRMRNKSVDLTGMCVVEYHS